MRLIVLLASALLLAGCGDVHTAGQDCCAPSPTTAVTPGVQTRLVLLASSRSDQQLDVSAEVLDGRGVGVPNVEVTFSITGGIVTPATVKTNANGIAKAIAIATGTATLSATTGTLSQSATVIGSATPIAVSLSVPSIVINNPSVFTAIVTGQPLGGPFAYAWTFGDGTSASTDTGGTTHAYNRSGSFIASVRVTDGAGRTGTSTATASVTDPPAPPTPPPPPPAAALSVTLTCTPAAHGTASPCNVNATYGGTQLSATAIARVDWDWGDGTTSPNGGVVATRTYVNAGTYVVFATVTANTGDGVKGPVIVSKTITVN